MKKIGWRVSRVIVGILIAVCVLGSPCFSEVAGSVGEESETSVDTLRAEGSPAKSVDIRSESELIARYNEVAIPLIDILVPDPAYTQVVDLGRLTFDDLSSEFDPKFIELLAKYKFVNEFGTAEYPILIKLDKMHNYVIESGDETELEVIKRDNKDYSIYWYAIEHFKKYPPTDGKKISRRDFLAYHSMHNQKRVIGYARLVTVEAAKIIDAQLKQEEAALDEMPPEPFPSPIMLMGGGTPTNLMFTYLSKNTNGTLDITIEWPQGCLNTNMVDFFVTEDLTQPLDWEIALTTNINLSSNSFSWTDTISTNRPIFYDVWTLDDTDGDSLSDGREVRMYGTDENDADTDDDGLDDGEEIYAYETDPLNSDSDSDGLNDGEEINQYYTDPLNSDSDGDGVSDGAEINNTSNPLLPDFKVISGSENLVVSNSLHMIIPQYVDEITVTVVVFSEEYPDYTADQSEYNDEVSYTIVSPNGTLDNQAYDVNSLHSSFVETDDYEDAVSVYNGVLIWALKDWADAVYKRFSEGHWRTSGPETKWIPTSISSVSFIAEQTAYNVPYADLTHKFGTTNLVSLTPVIINGRRYPQTLVTVPVYYWDYVTGTNVGNLFIGDSRVEQVIKAFVEQIPYDELNNRYNTAPPTGVVRTVQWEFSMADHHKLYWTSDTDISLTGGDDTLLKINIFNQEELALGDVWVVGSDPANMLYGGSGYIELKVEKLPSGDLKIHTNPNVNMTVEDMFDFNYWNGVAANAAASIQCAHGRATIPAGVGDVALLKFDVDTKVDNIGDIIITRP